MLSYLVKVEEESRQARERRGKSGEGAVAGGRKKADKGGAGARREEQAGIMAA